MFNFQSQSPYKSNVEHIPTSRLF